MIEVVAAIGMGMFGVILSQLGIPNTLVVLGLIRGSK